MNNVLGTEDGWPWLLAITAVPAIFQLATLPFCPESPKYLLLDKDDEMAAEAGNISAINHEKICYYQKSKPTPSSF